MIITAANAAREYTVHVNRPLTSAELIAQLTSALEAADLYLNSYDVSAPSRIKADTRLAVEEALGAAKAIAAEAAAIAALDPEVASLPLGGVTTVARRRHHTHTVDCGEARNECPKGAN